jgi:DNA replication protein DnaC
MSVPYEQKALSGLEQLGLTVAHAQLDAAAQRAAAEGWTYSHFLGYLLDGELSERQRKRVELNLKFAKFPYLKELSGFDFAVQPSIDRRVVDELATGRYLSEGRNVVLLGPPGVGKTHLAIGLGVKVAEMGHRVYLLIPTLRSDFPLRSSLLCARTAAINSQRERGEVGAAMFH